MLADSIFIIRSPRIYSATSTISITSTQANRLSLMQGAAGGGDTDVATDVSLIQTHEVMSRAASTLKTLGFSIPEGAIAGSAMPTPVADTSLINVTVEWPDPKIARDIANAVAQAFVDERQYRASQADTQTVKFLGQELAQASDKLSSVEKSLKDFQASHGLGATTDLGGGAASSTVPGATTPSPGAGPSVVGQLNAVRQSLQDALTQQAVNDRLIADRRQRLAQLNSRLLQQGSTSIVASETIDNLQQQLNTEEAQLASAQDTYTPEGIRTLQPHLSEDIRRLQSQLNAQIRHVVSGSTVDMAAQQKLTGDLADAEMQRDGLATQIASLRQQVATLQAQAQKEPDIAAQLNRIVRQRDVLQQAYQTLIERQEQVAISLSAVQGDAEIAARAALPTSPIRPKPFRDSLVGLAFGLLAGCSLALLVEYMDNTIHTIDEISHQLALPPLGAIPIADLKPSLVWQHQHSSATLASESFRMLRSSINYLGVEDDVRSILVTSANPGEGKTSIITNLAASLAQSGKRVVVVDADLRKPGVYKLIGGGRSHGLAEVLTGRCTPEEAVRLSDVPGVWTIPVEKLPPNPVELLGSPRMKALLEYLHGAFDIVLVDSPPCLIVADAIVLASQVDIVIQVVAAGKTARRAAMRARDALTSARGRLVGAVLNRFNPEVDSSYYYYYYYYPEGNPEKLEGPHPENGKN
jgi:capsular exopolysaccharide synthesis family protein